MLRPPARFADLDAVFTELTRRLVDEGAEFRLSAEVVDIVARVIQEWVTAGWEEASRP